MYVFNGKSISSKKYFYAYIRTLTPKAMLGFHSQNVLQILENMKPIIFRINVTDEGEITFNKVEGMTNSQAYELMLRKGYGKEGDEPDSFKKSKYFRRNSHRRVSLLPFRL